nr:MAG TPA: hypothetical protein [Caudoviricetes sp.]
MNQTCFSHYVTHIKDVSVTVTDCYYVASSLSPKGEIDIASSRQVAMRTIKVHHSRLCRYRISMI